MLMASEVGWIKLIYYRERYLRIFEVRQIKCTLYTLAFENNKLCYIIKNPIELGICSALSNPFGTRFENIVLDLKKHFDEKIECYLNYCFLYNAFYFNVIKKFRVCEFIQMEM